MNISTNYAGLKLKSPIIVGSCGLTSTTKHLKDFEEKGAGAIVLKSIFEEEIVLEFDKYLKEADKFGYTDDNIDYYDYKIKQDNINKYIKLIKDAKQEVSIPVIASINCACQHEWTYYTKKIEAAGADALELNIFILPSCLEKSSSKIEEMYFDIIKKVSEEIKIPLIIKMSSFFTNLGKMIIELSKTNIKGIVLFNKYYSPDINIRTKKATVANIFSSRADMRVPLRWMALTSDKTDCSLASSTGVHEGEDLVKMILAGADAVQIVSTVYKNGLDKIEELKDFLENYLEENNYNSLDDIKGIANQKNIEKPGMFERVQFMRYFSDNEDDIL